MAAELVRTPSRAALAAPGAPDPTYIQGRSRSEITAHFHSGVSVQVQASRVRRYPRIDTAAPDTLDCYRYFAGRVPTAQKLVDLGCGVGLGLLILKEAGFADLCGLDCDGSAVAFARQFAPHIATSRVDRQLRSATLTCDSVLIVDVLGLVAHPAAMLRAVVQHAPHLCQLLVAEPLANREQRLQPPARRAFSVPALASMLVRCGFEVDDIELHSGLLCAVTHPIRDPACAWLARAEQAYTEHQTQLLLDLCSEIRKSSNLALRAEAALLESRLRFDLEQRDRAIAALSDARALAPNDPRPVAGLARLALTTGNMSQAQSLAEAALLADPLDWSSVVTAALAHSLERPRLALPLFRYANRLAPDSPLIGQMALLAAQADGEMAQSLEILELLSQYGEGSRDTDDHVALSCLLNSAQRQSLKACGHESDTVGITKR